MPGVHGWVFIIGMRGTGRRHRIHCGDLRAVRMRIPLTIIGNDGQSQTAAGALAH